MITHYKNPQTNFIGSRLRPNSFNLFYLNILNLSRNFNIRGDLVLSHDVQTPITKPCHFKVKVKKLNQTLMAHNS